MEINRLIDHTLLIPSAPLGNYTDLCRQAVKWNFHSVCVSSFHVPLVSNLLHSYVHTDMSVNIKICSVIGFPHGISNIDSKVTEMQRAFNDGATEFDFVLNISAVKTGDWLRIKHEFETLRKTIPTAPTFQPILKVILECGLLSDDEIKHCCDLAIETGLSYVKTSTGFLAKLEPKETARYVKLMADQVKGSGVLVKASGGIRSLIDLEMMIEAGASRVGTSNSIKIMEEFQRRAKMDEIPKMSDEQFKEMAKIEEETTKEVVGPLAISPEILKEVKEANEVKVPGKKDKKLIPKSFYCSTCRENFLEDKADKRPMGFDRAEDGSLLNTSKRFSIFCPSCARFILIQDPETDAKIKDAIDKVGNK
jgi:deoxyribose-phosphate aldolase